MGKKVIRLNATHGQVELSGRWLSWDTLSYMCMNPSNLRSGKNEMLLSSRLEITRDHCGWTIVLKPRWHDIMRNQTAVGPSVQLWRFLRCAVCLSKSVFITGKIAIRHKTSFGSTEWSCSKHTTTASCKSLVFRQKTKPSGWMQLWTGPVAFTGHRGLWCHYIFWPYVPIIFLWWVISRHPHRDCLFCTPECLCQLGATKRMRAWQDHARFDD